VLAVEPLQASAHLNSMIRRRLLVDRMPRGLRRGEVKQRRATEDNLSCAQMCIEGRLRRE